MAIFIASTKSISRAKGQSAVASASYRAGEKLLDHRYGKTHDYTKKVGVVSAKIILPSALKSRIDREELWNLAEKSETRKNSRVAREWLINLPHELDEQTRGKLAHEFAQRLADKFNVIADCAIHKPTEREIERGADDRNHHAHILLTTRQAELDENGKITLTAKSDCELSDSDREKKGLNKAKDEVSEIRQLWETLANERLLEHGHDPIDSRSYRDRGLDVEPQIKMGAVATRLERDKYEREQERKKSAIAQGENYEIDETPATIRGEINRAIKERNQIIFNRRVDRERRRSAIVLYNRTNKSIDKSEFRINQTKRYIKKSDQTLDQSKRAIERSAKKIESAPIKNREHNEYREQFIQIYREFRKRAKERERRDQARERRNQERERRTREFSSAAEKVNRTARRLALGNGDQYAIARRSDRTIEFMIDDFAKRLSIYDRADVDVYDEHQMEIIKNFWEDMGFDSHRHNWRFSSYRYGRIKESLNMDFMRQHREVFAIAKDPEAHRNRRNESIKNPSATSVADDIKNRLESDTVTNRHGNPEPEPEIEIKTPSYRFRP